MSARLFLGYFIVLAAGATLVFGSSWMEPAPASPSADERSAADEYLPLRPIFHVHTRKPIVRAPQMAQAE